MKKRNELKLTVSGMDDDMLKALYRFLDYYNYDYVASGESYYIDGEGNVVDKEKPSMTFEDFIKQMSHRELQNFIYWVYENGHDDAFFGAEDSPGCNSFFGGGILACPASEVIEKLDNYYGDHWRDE